MAYIVERDNKKNQYVSGFSPVMGTIEVNREPYEFKTKAEAQQVADTLNLMALKVDDPYRFIVAKRTLEIVKGNYTHAGNKDSAYSKRVGEVEHEAVVEIEE